MEKNINFIFIGPNKEHFETYSRLFIGLGKTVKPIYCKSGNEFYKEAETAKEGENIVIADLNPFLKEIDDPGNFFGDLNNMTGENSRTYVYFQYFSNDKSGDCHVSRLHTIGIADMDHADFKLNCHPLVSPEDERSFYHDKTILRGLFSLINGGASTYQDKWFEPFDSTVQYAKRIKAGAAVNH